MEAISEILKKFEEYSNEYAKLFIPEDNDEKILNSLYVFYKEHYDLELLEECIKLYIKGLPSDEVVTVKTFALTSGKIRGKALDERRDKNEIKELMRETGERMKRFNEL